MTDKVPDKAADKAADKGPDKLPLTNPAVDPPGVPPSSTASISAPPEGGASLPPPTREEIAATEASLGLAVASSAAPAARASVRLGMAPSTIEEGWRLAQLIAQSDLVPKGYQKRPADVLVAIQYGMEVGLPPMAALHSIYVTNGRPQLWGDGFLAVIMAAPAYRDHEEYFLVAGKQTEFLVAADLGKDDTAAVCTFWRKDNPRPRTAAFSIAQAKKANLWAKAGPWTQYPDQMLTMRARSFAGHKAFPDVLRGIGNDAQEIDPPAADDAIELREVTRISERALP